jgi:hypothetical protein
MFRGFKETLDGEWVPGEGYHAFDLPDEPGDFDHRFQVLPQLGSLKIPGLRRSTPRCRAQLPKVWCSIAAPAGTEAAPALNRDARLAQAAVCGGLCGTRKGRRCCSMRRSMEPTRGREDSLRGGH